MVIVGTLLTYRVEVDWGPFLSGLLVMEAEIKTAATVMAILLVPTPSQLAPPVREMSSRGTWRDVHQPLPQPIAVETKLKNKL